MRSLIASGFSRVPDDGRRARHGGITIRYRSYLAAVDVFHGGLAKQKVHVILRLEAADELRVVQPPERKALYRRGKQDPPSLRELVREIR